MKIDLKQGNCLEVMKEIPAGSVDMILCDLPYGTTACKWDTVIPFEPLWEQYKRVIKANGAIVLFGSQPFTTLLIGSNLADFKYQWVWEKSKGSNFTHAKNMPIKLHEDICVFSMGKIGHLTKLGSKRMNYNPQGLVRVDKEWSRPKKYNSEHRLDRPSHSLDRVIEFENFPRSVLKIGNSDNRERGLHPTQKPVALCEYLIRTYTNKDALVLDNTMGSGTTGVACVNTGRNFIGIEQDEKYFQIAKSRIESVTNLNEFI
jgi:site-specific DNA-methyltransferase (adenine-specific)